jgi:hypothetical protein
VVFYSLLFKAKLASEENYRNMFSRSLSKLVNYNVCHYAGNNIINLYVTVTPCSCYLHRLAFSTFGISFVKFSVALLQDGKMAEDDDVLPNGYKVIKGDGINYMIYAMGRMTYLWGEDAEDFRPERWIANGVFQQESPYKFVSFNVSITH